MDVQPRKVAKRDLRVVEDLTAITPLATLHARVAAAMDSSTGACHLFVPDVSDGSEGWVTVARDGPQTTLRGELLLLLLPMPVLARGPFADLC